MVSLIPYAVGGIVLILAYRSKRIQERFGERQKGNIAVLIAVGSMALTTVLIQLLSR